MAPSGHTDNALSAQPAVALNIHKAEADSLAAEVASLAGETKTGDDFRHTDLVSASALPTQL